MPGGLPSPDVPAGAPTTPEPLSGPERKDSAEVIKKQFDFVHARLVAAKAEGRLDEKEQWALESAENAKKESLDKGKDTLTVEFDDINDPSVKHTQEEGIPVEGLLKFLKKEIDSLDPSKPDDAATRKKLFRAGRVLYRNSKRYSELPGRGGVDQFRSRIRHEAHFISNPTDYRKTGTEEGDYFTALDELLGKDRTADVAAERPTPTRRAGLEWYKAVDEATSTVNRRLELVIPGSSLDTIPTGDPLPVDAPPTGGTPPAETVPPTPSEPTPLALVAHDFAIANATLDPRRRAAELAGKAIQDQRAELQKKRVWDPRRWFGSAKLYAMEDYYRQVYQERATVAMKENSNPLLEMDLIKNAAANATKNKDQHIKEQQSKVKQVKRMANAGIELENQTVLKAEGELKTMIIDKFIKPVVSGEIVNRTQLQDRLKSFVHDTLQDPNIPQDIKDRIGRVFGTAATEYNINADYFASDILETGLKVKHDKEAHGLALNQIDQIIGNIYIANTSWAAETSSSAYFNWVDKKVAQIQGTRLAPFLTPAAAGAIASLITFGTTKLAGTTGKYAQLAVPGAGMIVGAGVAAIRRNYELKKDIGVHRVERAYGMNFSPQEAPRRNALENFQFNTASVNNLINGGGQELVGGAERKSMVDLLNADLSNTTNRETIVRRIAEMYARLDYSSTHKVDLVTFASRGDVEEGRLQLIETIAEATLKLTDAGVDPDSLNREVTRVSGEWKAKFSDDKTVQDKEFQAYRLKESAKAAAFGAVTGAAIGLLLQEGFALGGRHIPGLSEAPVIGSLFQKGETVGEKLWNAPGKVMRGESLGSVDDWFGARTREPGFGRDTAKELYTKPGGTEVAPGVRLIADAGPNGAPHGAQLIDAKTNLPLASGQLSPDGKVSLPGRPSDLDPKLNFLADWNHQTTEDPNFNATKLRDIWEKHPASVKVGDNLVMHVGRVINSTVKGEGLVQAPEHYPVTFTDVDGKPIPSTPMYISPDSKLIVSGNPDTLPVVVKDFVKGWQTGEGKATEANLFDQIKASIDNNRHHTFRHGNTEIDLNTNPGTFSIKDFPSNTQVHGVVENGVLVIDPSIPGNPNAQGIATLESRLKMEGWAVQREIIPGKQATGSVVDALLQRPDILKQFGVVETDQFKKEWKFHVLRPDIVAATGMHTHNELTLHVGGEYTVTSGTTPETRTGINPPGWITINGNVDGGPIPSFLKGVPPAVDKDLQAIIQKSGEIKYTDMVLAVDLKDGNQVMAQIQELKGPNGKTQYGIKLPEGLYKPNGQLIGIESISEAILTKKDGTMIRANELLSSGSLPEGTIVHSLASERFASADIPPAPNVPDKSVLKLTPPKLQEFIAPPEKPVTVFIPKEPIFFEQPPIIPIPLSRRHPLEGMVPPDAEGPIYYMRRVSPEERAEFEKRRSPRLSENPNARLNARQEATWYFEQLGTEYKEELERMNQAIGAPMSEECKAVISISAASHQEGNNIYNTLLQYTDQRDEKGNPLNPNAYEISLFLNRPEYTKDATGNLVSTVPDNTAAEVQRFKREHPEVKVNVIDKVFPGTRPNMGIISKYPADLALLRSLQRRNASDFALIMNDADTDLTSKRYVNSVLQQFNENPQIDALLGKIEWNPEAYIKYPGFHIANRFYQYLETQLRHADSNMRNIGSSGANFSIRSSMYAAVGGYLESTDLAQDVQLGNMVKVNRGDELREKPEAIGYSGAAWVMTNPRRGTQAYEQGKAVVSQWANWRDNQTDVRGNWRARPVTAEDVDSLDPEHIQMDINAAISIYGSGPYSKTATRALNLLGLYTKEATQSRIDRLQNRGLSPTSPEVQNTIAKLGLRPEDYHIEGGKIVIDNGSYRIEKQDGKDMVVVTNLTRIKADLKRYKDEQRDKINEKKNAAIIT